jgi:hypothetical protein
MEWVVNATPQPPYSWERAGTHCVGVSTELHTLAQKYVLDTTRHNGMDFVKIIWEAVWALGPVWTGVGNPAPHRDLIPGTFSL